MWKLNSGIFVLCLGINTLKILLNSHERASYVAIECNSGIGDTSTSPAASQHQLAQKNTFCHGPSDVSFILGGRAILKLPPKNKKSCG